MSIASEISRIQQAKADIKIAIEAKGVTVPSSATIDTYDDYVSQISGGGGSTADTQALIDLIERDVTSIEIPSGVTSIGSSAFQNCSGLTSVTIPDSVTSIGTSAFTNCSSLTSVTIPNGVTRIYSNVFCDCSGLTEVIIPDSVTYIGSYAFRSCRSLPSITIPSGVTSISPYTFTACWSLSSVTIPSGVDFIGLSAFANCTGLTSIDIPSGVTSIGNNAFNNCSGLTSVTCLATTPPTLGTNVFNNTNNCPIYVPSGSVSSYQSAWSTYASRIQAIPSPTPPSFDGKWLATYEGGSTDSAACDSSSAISRSEIDTYDLIDLQIGDCVTSIGYYGLYNAYYLTGVTIGTGITSIGESAFDSCSSLQDITINATAPPSLGRKAFQSCSSLSNIYVPSESVSDYQSASGWSTYASRIQAIPSPTPTGDTWTQYSAGSSIDADIRGIRISENTTIPDEAFISVDLTNSNLTLDIGEYCESEDTPCTTKVNFWQIWDNIQDIEIEFGPLTYTDGYWTYTQDVTHITNASLPFDIEVILDN